MKNQVEALKKVLKDKEREISSLREKVRQAKVGEETELRSSDGFLAELGGYYADKFNECLYQFKALFPNLDMSRVFLDNVAQTPARSAEFEGTGELISADPTPDVQGDRGAVPQDVQAKSVSNETCLADEAKVAEKVVDEEAPVDQPQTSIVFF